ncbi:MFS multidrug transporter [Paraphaeosphaeria sporulosa]
MRTQSTHNWGLHTPYGFGEHPGQTVSTRFKRTFPQPLRILLSPSFFFTSFIPAAGYAILYFEIAVGIIIAIATGAATSEKYATLQATRNDTRAENRLVQLLCFWPFTPPGALSIRILLRQKMHWAGAIVSLGFIGAGVMFAIQLNGLYLIDAFPTRFISATHASILLQPLLGAPSHYSHKNCTIMLVHRTYSIFCGAFHSF